MNKEIEISKDYKVYGCVFNASLLTYYFKKKRSHELDRFSNTIFQG